MVLLAFTHTWAQKTLPIDVRVFCCEIYTLKPGLGTALTRKTHQTMTSPFFYLRGAFL